MGSPLLPSLYTPDVPWGAARGPDPHGDERSGALLPDMLEPDFDYPVGPPPTAPYLLPHIAHPAELPHGGYRALDDFVEDEAADYEIGNECVELGDTPGTGLAAQVGPFPAWIWLTGLGTVLGFWLYTRGERR